MPVFIQENHLNRIITIPAPRGVAQRCGIPCASSWPFVRVVAGTMWGGGDFMAGIAPTLWLSWGARVRFVASLL